MLQFVPLCLDGLPSHSQTLHVSFLRPEKQVIVFWVTSLEKVIIIQYPIHFSSVNFTPCVYCVYILLKGGGQRRWQDLRGGLPSTLCYHYNKFAHVLHTLEYSAVGNLKQKSKTRRSSSIYFTQFILHYITIHNIIFLFSHIKMHNTKSWKWMFSLICPGIFKVKTTSLWKPCIISNTWLHSFMVMPLKKSW